MTPDFVNTLHSTPPADVAEAVRNRPLDADDLRAALADAFDRIAALEQLHRIY